MIFDSFRKFQNSHFLNAYMGGKVYCASQLSLHKICFEIIENRVGRQK